MRCFREYTSERIIGRTPQQGKIVWRIYDGKIPAKSMTKLEESGIDEVEDTHLNLHFKINH